MNSNYSPPVTFYSHVKALPREEDMYKFLGKDGVHFKVLTNKLRLDYIWWNKEQNVIELWGAHKYLKRANKQMTLKLKAYIQEKYENEAIKYANMFN